MAIQDSLSLFFNNILRRKVLTETKNDLERKLGALDLIGFGVGSIVGAGIFVLAGYAASEAAGPAIFISFIIDFFACIFSALAYAEFAARQPVAGSAYSYAYYSMGEILAFIIGWTIFLSYSFSVAAVARGWVGYLAALLEGFGVDLKGHEKVFNYPWQVNFGLFKYEFQINWIAAVVLLIITCYVLFGMQQSSMFNLIVTGISLVIIVFVIIYGAVFIDTKNWTNDFLPYGVNGIFKGAAIVFFAYIGFDSIANFSEEVKNPNRNLPIGIIGSLSICSVLYIAVSIVLTGMQPYDNLDKDAPLAVAFEQDPINQGWAAVVVSLGAFCGLTTSMLVALMSAARVIFAMSRDGLLPPFISWINPRTNAASWSNVVSGVFSMFLAFAFDLDGLADVVSIGMLVAFILVCICVLLIRVEDSDEQKESHLIDNNSKQFILTLLFLVMIAVVAFSAAILLEAPLYIWAPLSIPVILPTICIVGYYIKYVKKSNRTTFQCPFVPFFPLIGIIINVYMICNLEYPSWIVIILWQLLGISIYLLYGYNHSIVFKEREKESVAEWHSDNETKSYDTFSNKSGYSEIISESDDDENNVNFTSSKQKRINSVKEYNF